MHKEWRTPPGQVYSLYRDMLKQPHLLIAGATGSGKSVVINGLVYTAMYDSPAAVQFILIDPKRVELVDYKPLPHTLMYASEPGEMVEALEKAMEQAEVGIESVLEVCKIKDLRDMTIDQFTKICTKLQNTMEKKGKQGDA